jgi:CMP-N-acetylneuraminic acid synthetase
MSGRVIAVIPARERSRRVPFKSQRTLGGVPLVSWTILAARNAGCLTDVVVTSDSAEIRRLAIDLGASAVTQPDEIAREGVSAHWALQDALGQAGGEYDVAVLLLPTSPFRTSDQIDAAFRMWSDRREHPLISVTAQPDLARRLRSVSGGQLWPVASLSVNGGDLALSNGAIKIDTLDRILSVPWASCFPVESSTAYVMDATSGLDIDTPEDWTLAQQIAAFRQMEAA